MVTADELLGKTVIGAAGNYIGEVKNIDVDAESWYVTHLHVKLSDKATKEFGIKKTLKGCSVRIPTTLINKIDVIITLNQSLTDLKNILSLVYT